MHGSDFIQDLAVVMLVAGLAPARHAGVPVAGISREGHRQLNPGGEVRLLPGDDVLVLGNRDQIAAFRAGANGN